MAPNVLVTDVTRDAILTASALVPAISSEIEYFCAGQATLYSDFDRGVWSIDAIYK